MRTPEPQDKPKARRRVKRWRNVRCSCFVCIGEAFPRGRSKDRLRREIDDEG